MTASTVDATYLQSWLAWHEKRVREATEAYGVAAGIATEWLTDVSQPVDGLPGTWRLDGEEVVGENLGADLELYRVPDLITPLDHGGVIRLAVREAVQCGHLRIVGFKRALDRGLRVYDPTAEARTSLLDIAVWQPDPAYIVPARFEAAGDDDTVVTDQTDGGQVRRRFIGTAYFELGGTEHSLNIVIHHTVPGLGFLSFTDLTSGVDTFRFRFLDVELTGSDQVTIDFNRAYLPPASFSAGYSCPLPLRGNIIDYAVRAGERSQVRAS